VFINIIVIYWRVQIDYWRSILHDWLFIVCPNNVVSDGRTAIEVEKDRLFIVCAGSKGDKKRDGETTNTTTIDEINYEFIIRRFICHCKEYKCKSLGVSRVSVNNQNNATQHSFQFGFLGHPLLLSLIGSCIYQQPSSIIFVSFYAIFSISESYRNYWSDTCMFVIWSVGNI